MNNEVRPSGDMEGLGKIAELVHRAEVVLVTSTLTRAEILQSKTTPEAMKRYDMLLRRSNVVAQNMDLPIAKLTSELMDYYLQSDFELLTPDAIHLATAIHVNVDEFHTFDGSTPKKPRRSKFARSGLLLLNGSVAGRKLTIARPSADQYELSLPPISALSDDSLFQLQSVVEPPSAEQESLYLLPPPEPKEEN